MTDQLPIITSEKNISTAKTASTTLLGRGLAAIKSQRLQLNLVAIPDEIYRQARDIFNRITGYGDQVCVAGDSWSDEELAELYDCFDKLNRLVNIDYGKAFFLLWNLYRGGAKAHRNEILAETFGQKAFDWCFDNQFENDPEIWNDLGALYRLGIGCEVDEKLAMYWFRQSADVGNAEGMFNVSGMYEFGVGVEEDLETAHYWQVMAAEAGHAYAQHGLAFQYHHGLNEQYEQDEELAFYWYLRSAVGGYEGATYGLHELRYYGFGFELKDDFSFEWFRRKAECGYVFAQLFLADAYKHGLDVDQDYYEAAKWLKLAAEQDDPYAQWKYGLLQWIEDSDEASYWLRKAAKTGNAEAQYDLAWLITETREIEEGEIYYWLECATFQKYEPATFICENYFIIEHWNYRHKSEVFGLAYSWCRRRRGILIHDEDCESLIKFIDEKFNSDFFKKNKWIDEIKQRDYTHQEFYFLTSAAKLGNVEAINRLSELEIEF